jgi:hypothetical protein
MTLVVMVVIVIMLTQHSIGAHLVSILVYVSDVMEEPFKGL